MFPNTELDVYSVTMNLTVLTKMKFLYAVMYARSLRRERRFRDRLDPLGLSDNYSGVISHYRFPRDELLQLMQELELALRRARRSLAISRQWILPSTLRVTPRDTLHCIPNAHLSSLPVFACQ